MNQVWLQLNLNSLYETQYSENLIDKQTFLKIETHDVDNLQPFK